MAPASVLDLFGLLQSSTSQLHHSLSVHLTVPSASELTSSINQVTTLTSSTLRSTFTSSRSNTESNTLSKPNIIAIEWPAQILAIDEIVLLIISYLDGESLSRVQGVSKAWREFIQQHLERLYQVLIYERQVFHTVITSRSAFLSYLFSKRHELDQELAHTHAVQSKYQALEQYCTSTEDHGFVAMFCDIIEFTNPKIARFVALKRQSALSMVLAATPTHVMKFRKQSKFVGPITFVPVDNPLWPVFTLSPVTARGFLGYAFDHVRVVHGYEALKDTVIKSILKDLMIFDTMEHIAAYERRIGYAPYATSLDYDAEMPDVGRHLIFSSSLRRQLEKYPVAERIGRLYVRIKAVDNCIATTLANL
ncbi:putative F-box domain-containing protein [Plasmopara halstedii]